MTIRSYTKLELDTQEKLSQAEALLIQLHQIVTQAPDVSGTELEATNIVTKELNYTVCMCYDLLTDYLVDEESVV